MEDMSHKNRKYLIDLMFDGVDENGRPYGVYIRNVEGKVFEYEIHGRFAVGSRFMKNEDYDYYGRKDGKSAIRILMRLPWGDVNSIDD